MTRDNDARHDADPTRRDADRGGAQGPAAALAAVATTLVLWASAFVGIRHLGESVPPGALSLSRLLVMALALLALMKGRLPRLPDEARVAADRRRWGELVRRLQPRPQRVRAAHRRGHGGADRADRSAPRSRCSRRSSSASGSRSGCSSAWASASPAWSSSAARPPGVTAATWSACCSRWSRH
ncbi:hypothetical protein [Nocardioides sp. B-3]|uniref:hypothetical protein n=1 Tax=Nocardioides sp. B-3 TaxID=2895565 RepID=UPI002152798E|nr:hypothetical protein [Nocardioides sp. B-3]UUZ57691.1 hypothetical protein LP418_14715 [Nocardioides sp. B-3]